MFRNDGFQKMPIKTMKTIKTLEKGLIIIILYLFDFLFDVLKIDMEIILLSKPDPMVQSAYQW